MEQDEEIPYYQEVHVAGDSLANKAKRVLTSSFLFLLTFILSNLLLQALVARVAGALKYKHKFSYNLVHMYQWDYHYWSHTNIVLIYFFSPVACLLLGLFILGMLLAKTTWSSVLRIFFFWLGVNLTNMVLTHALLSPLGSPTDRHNGFYQTFAVVGAFFWINPALMTMFAIAALVTTLLLGVILRPEIMRYSFSRKMISNKRGMDQVTIQVFVMPVIVACVPAILLCTPGGFFTTLMQFANLGVVSIGIFMMNSNGMPNVRSNKDDVLNHFPVIEAAICSAVWFGVFTFLK